MDIRIVHEETGAAWNATAALYERDEQETVEFLKAGGSSLMAAERRILGDLSGWCQLAIHLQCSGGKDALSLWRQGAAEVVGVDISERMIAVAKRIAQALQAPASWYCCDILQSPHTLDDTADLVYTGRGALPWMWDIATWAQVVARLLKPGGRLYVFEGHPLDWVWDASAAEYRLDPQHGDYFSDKSNDQCWPSPFLARLDWSGKEKPRPRARQWTLGPVMNALVEAGLCLEHFEEHPDLYWDQFPNLPAEVARRLPHTFSLLMRKT
jgi:SAM-dependent methyltransferase